MKRSLLFLLPLLVLAACQDAPDTAGPGVDGTPPTQDEGHVADLGAVVGEDPGDGPVLFVEQVVENPEAYDGQPVRIAGVVGEVCQQAGCWLTFQNAEGTPFRVAVPRGDDGYVFTFPKGIAGQNAVIAGTFAVEETDVATLRHLAEDAGKSAEEVAAITEPERTFTLAATGARLEGEV